MKGKPLYVENPTADALVDLCSEIVRVFSATTPNSQHPVKYPYTRNYPIELYLYDYQIEPITLDLPDCQLIWPTKALGMYTPRCVMLKNQTGLGTIVPIYGAQNDLYATLIRRDCEFYLKDLHDFLLKVYHIADHYRKVAMGQLIAHLNHPAWKQVEMLNVMHVLQGISNPLQQEQRNIRDRYRPNDVYTADVLRLYDKRLSQLALFYNGVVQTLAAHLSRNHPQARRKHIFTLDVCTATFRTDDDALIMHFEYDPEGDISSTVRICTGSSTWTYEQDALDLLDVTGINPMAAYRIYLAAWKLLS